VLGQYLYLVDVLHGWRGNCARTPTVFMNSGHWSDFPILRPILLPPERTKRHYPFACSADLQVRVAPLVRFRCTPETANLPHDHEFVLGLLPAELALWSADRRGYDGDWFSWPVRNTEMGAAGSWR
jgi:hypothetical protein